MADETMFARLVAAVVRDLERQVGEDRGTGLGYCDADDPKAAKIDGNLDLTAIVRALLTELRTIADESRPGMIAIEGTLTKEQADALRKRWAEMDYERPSVKFLEHATFTSIAQSPAAFIDAILAEAGGSGGA